MAKQVSAAHILVDSKEKATEIKEKISNGSSFADMAKKHSACPSGRKGGDLGWFGPGDMVPEFEKAAFSAKKGDIIIVRTKFGWHLLLVKDMK